MLISYMILDQVWTEPVRLVEKNHAGEPVVPGVLLRHHVLYKADGAIEVFQAIGADAEPVVRKYVSPGDIWPQFVGGLLPPDHKIDGVNVNPFSAPCRVIPVSGGAAELEVDEPGYVQLRLDVGSGPAGVESALAFVELSPGYWTTKAVWTTAYVNDLPDSAFLYVESGGTKDSGGKTVPRSLRHFPVRDANGRPDAAHLRNAIARIPQSNAPGLSADKKQQLQERARSLLARANKGQEEPGDPEIGPIVHVTSSPPSTVSTTVVPTEKVYVAKLLKLAEALPAPLAEQEERYVLGVVLEPETPDSQNDIYSEAEIRKTAHRFMEEYSGQLGEMHRRKLKNGEAVLLETYLAPVPFQYGDQFVKKGSWLVGARINADDVWAKVKSGEYNSWSIGGSALREPAGVDSSADSDVYPSPFGGLPPAGA